MNRFFLFTFLSVISAAGGSFAAENSTGQGDTLRKLVQGQKVEPAFSNTLANAQAGDANAQVALGNVFAEGLYGVPQNDAEAFRWYERAAEAGNSMGEFMLGSCYEQGKGPAKSFSEAAAWYKRSAGKGFAAAQAALGTLYSTGQGVARDPVEAYKWFALAAASGDTKAGEDRLKLAESMPLPDVAEGEYRAGSFRPVTGTQAGRKSQDDSPAPKSIEAGFFITADGYFLSRFHVTKDAQKIMVKNRNGLLPAQFVKGDIGADLAIYKVQGSFAAVPLALGTTPGKGSAVLVPRFNNEDWKEARIAPQVGTVLGMAPKMADTFQVGFGRPGENAGGCVLDSTGSAIGLATFRTFLPQQRNAFVSATALTAFGRLIFFQFAGCASGVGSGRETGSVKVARRGLTGLLLSY